jgi:hypothetical protein
MAFGQLTYRENLRDIVEFFREQSSNFYHIGISTSVSRDKLSNANKLGDWRIYGSIMQWLIAIPRKL